MKVNETAVQQQDDNLKDLRERTQDETMNLSIQMRPMN